MNVSEAIDIAPVESAAEKKKRIARENYRKRYVDNLERERKASLARYYKNRGSDVRPPGRPRKYEIPESA